MFFKTNSIIKNFYQLLVVVVILQMFFLFMLYAFKINRTMFSERKAIVESTMSILEKLLSRPISQGDFISSSSYIQIENFPHFINKIKIVSKDNEVLISSTRDEMTCKNNIEYSKNILSNKFLSESPFAIAKMKMSVGNCDLYKNYINELLIIFLVIMILLLFMIVSTKKIFNNLTKPLKSIMNSSEANFTNQKIYNAAPIELKPILKEVKAWFEKTKILEVEKNKFAVANQVAHDIRSPLTALNVVSKDLAGLSEASRILLRSSIQRIQDIANNLVSESELYAQGSKESYEEDVLESSLLLPILEEIISEKRYQLRSKAGVNIALDGEKAYGLFSDVHVSSLKRIISNLINNSVEAFDDSGEVVITVSDNEKNNTEVLLSIKDNGKGISKDILPKLAQRGVSFGKDNDKESGSGLGLYHARANIERWGGRFLIESEEGEGTEIKLYLPKAKAPIWFVPAIHLKGIKNIVILDDDESIHQVWDRRLRDYVEQYTIDLQHARSPEDFKKMTENQENLLCLCDYELLGFEDTGLDLIEDNGLGDVSILVTSRYAEEKVQERCEKMGVKLIPKTSADLVPFNVEEVQRKAQYDAVLIDDDPLIRSVWTMRARDTDKSILMFKDPKVFYEKVDEISRQTPIYIDQNLSDGQLGTEVAKTIASLGFKKLYLATGEKKSSIKVQLQGDANIFLDIVGKDVPWE